MISLEKVLAAAVDMKPLSPCTGKLAGLVASESASLDDMAEVIRYDQMLTASVLKYANSVFSASKRPITSIRDALVRTGSAKVLELLLAHHVRETMSTHVAVYGYAEKELWRHSVAAALAVQLLGGLQPGSVDGIAFSAALLHDIGKTLIGRAAPAELMQSVWLLCTNEVDPLPWEQAERRVFGFTHADVGSQLAQSWHLPDAIVEAIRHHHATDREYGPVVDVVKVANAASKMIGAGLGHEGMSLVLDDHLEQRLGLTHEILEKLCAETSVRLQDVMALYAG
ncbi:MAG: HDOD domain-containing protein [Chitinivibrionales bacterium]|nr:HDOD domain-containing protein [Chitinivibrionales bacterium]